MRALVITALVGSLSLAGCTTDPVTGQTDYNKTAIGAGLGALLGAGVAKSNADKDKMGRAAAIGAVVGAAGGYYLDQKEKKLREQMAGTGVEVNRNEDGSVGLIMPGNITFATNSATISPNFYATLNKVAQTLAEDNKSAVVVSGYTDSSGNDSINIPLSQNRAQAVAQYLISQGVPSSRVSAKGYGAASPIADNSTAAGKQQNRRVELNIYAVQ
ncbi:OmpA family protein [Alkanindiges sp. WGS2144]|uniref:OmpA family protein n=1 Tax=Alkanindiges sp. WGS2144 TaxID=3366808 RepID=UPI00374FDE1D